MHIIKLELVTAEPSTDSYSLYPDYLIGYLLREGVGRVEADRALERDDKVDFIFTSRLTGGSKVIGKLQHGFFRSVLAHFGPRCGAQGLLYSGHTLFACEHECEGQQRMHRFSLFVCNEPTMGIWLRLYLYCIDGVFP